MIHNISHLEQIFCIKSEEKENIIYYFGVMKTTISPKNLFLIDSVGALLTSFLLIFVLAPYEIIFGVSRLILYPLAASALLFSIYSLVCFIVFPKNWRFWMKIIATLNLIYCAITFVVVILKSFISIFGIFYFIGEILIVAYLAYTELEVALKDE